MEVIAAEPSADMDCSSRAIVSDLTRLPSGLAGTDFALTSSGCHAGRASGTETAQGYRGGRPSNGDRRSGEMHRLLARRALAVRYPLQLGTIFLVLVAACAAQFALAMGAV
jgi:hypothetical protein